MAEESKYINPNHPVYFSYAGNNDASECDLEASVKQLRELFDRERIDYRDYKVKEKTTFGPQRTYVESEEEIGNGELVVVVLSDKYISLNYHGNTSLHCMYEWHCIVSREGYEKRVFPILVEDDMIKQTLTNTSLLTNFKNSYTAKYTDIHGEYVNNGCFLNDKLKRKFFETKGDAFRSDLDKMSGLVVNAPTFKQLELVVEKIKARIAELEQDVASNQNALSTAIQDEKKVFDLPKLNFETRTDVVKRDVETAKIKELFETNQIVNLIGVGGCGKTTITECYVNRFRNEYNNTIGVFINKDFYSEFSKKCLNKIYGEKATIGKVTRGSLGDLFSEVKNQTKSAPGLSLYNETIKDLEKYSKEEDKFNLLIIDINEFADYDNIEKALDDIRDTKKLRSWKILIVSREKMESARVHFDPLKLNTAEVDFDVLDAIFKKYLKGDERYCFTRKQLSALFLKLGHLPILIEHLAYYLRETSEVRTFEFIVDYLGDGFEDHKMWSRKYEKIQEFLSKLMRFDSLDDMQKSIVRLLVIWPAEYYSAGFIRNFMTLDNISTPRFINEVDEGLNILIDKCVLDSKDINKTRHYKIHDIISIQLKKQIFDENSINDIIINYAIYICNVKRILKSDDLLDHITTNCIKSTPLELFGIGSDKDYSVYEDWKFLRGLAQLKIDDAELSELSYKSKLFKEFYHLSGKEIYGKVYGEYKDVSSHLIYYRWLEGQSSVYNQPLPPEKFDKDFGCRFVTVPIKDLEIKMVRVCDDYFIAETPVTQDLWEKVMGYHRNWFNIDKLDRDTSKHPVEMVSWYDCMDFIIQLNMETKYKGFKFNFPTFEEWVFAASCRGKYKKFSGTDDDCLFAEFAWYKDNSVSTNVVKRLRPNDFGIYDMSGNVFEWIQDKSDSFSEKRLACGGAFSSTADVCKVSFRLGFSPATTGANVGFRLALSSSKKRRKIK
ncbi:MAG: SUMF1/EgtB/PvdO family nonheme iron enzyme [Bacteroidales bacterium]|nr:SUMF1/EgtB/PvdO family nonheme iron enzyme [Bacteroidales bacterium]